MAKRLTEFIRSPVGYRVIILSVGAALVAISVYHQNWTLALATAAVIGSAALMR